MIVFTFLSRDGQTLSQPIPNDYPEVLSYDGTFSISVNGKVFFEEAYFNLFEFLLYCRRWRPEEMKNMTYNCLDAEQNPLLSFIYTESGWRITSPWQKFDCREAFTSSELINAIEDMVKSIGIAAAYAISPTVTKCDKERILPHE